MAEVSIWTRRALTDAEAYKIEKLTGFEVILDNDRFETEEQGGGGDYSNYFLGIEPQHEDTELTEEYDGDWARAQITELEKLSIPCIYQMAVLEL